jgi:glutathione synthase/RimK-type ligase-like ATP-grasp enzyme
MEAVGVPRGFGYERAMPASPHHVGLLVGRERSFPNALIDEVARRNQDVVASYAKIDATRIDEPPPYDVLVDRISHEVTCYQPVLKLAALNGTRMVNNPFWRIADDKFFNTALAHKLGVAVPRTVVLPSKSYGQDVSEGTLSNLHFPVDWRKIVDYLGLPIFLKPHWGGGWRDVHRVDSLEQLLAAYDQTGRLTMIAQQGIRWTQYVRCIVIGKETVLPALWDPRLSHFDRYARAHEAMPPLSPELSERITSQARTLCRALGYDMNTVEFAIEDGVPYAIDFMNSAPDFDISSLGQSHFTWTVQAMADLVINLAKSPAPVEPRRWGDLL